MRSPRGMLMLLVFLVVATACGKNTGEQSAPVAATEGDPALDPVSKLDDLCKRAYANVQVPANFSVALVTDTGSVDDETVYQPAFEAMNAAERCFGITANIVEVAAKADSTRDLDTALRQQPNVVISIGSLLAPDTLSSARTHPDTNFVGVDQLQTSYPDNYVGILFREDESGFIVGAMAGLLTKSGVVGVVAGRKNAPPVLRFVNGLVQGAKSVNPSVQILPIYNESLEDPAKGASDARQLLDQGADVVLRAGGPTGSSGIKVAAEQGAWVIGADQDEYLTTFGKGTAAAADRLATSAVKRLDLGVFTVIADAVAGQFVGGTFVGNAENGGVTYAPFHDADIPTGVAKRIEEIRRGLAEGSIETGIDPATGQIINPA